MLYIFIILWLKYLQIIKCWEINFTNIFIVTCISYSKLVIIMDLLFSVHIKLNNLKTSHSSFDLDISSKYYIKNVTKTISAYNNLQWNIFCWFWSEKIRKYRHEILLKLYKNLNGRKYYGPYIRYIYLKISKIKFE